MTKKDQKAAEVLANRKVAFAKKAANLLGHVGGRIPAASITAAFNANMTAEEFAFTIASQEPVGLALHPLKAEAVKSAAADAAVTVGWVEAAGWDINVAAPRPSSMRMGRTEYKAAQARRSLFSSVTESAVEGYHYPRPGEPVLVRMSDESIARFISNAERDAAGQYDAFICKMVAKVGEVTDAQISGDHVWSYSTLFVTLPDGSTQKWRTQQIWNYSVYGLRYPQWPSRVVK
jgi:hypothetical protein